MSYRGPSFLDSAPSPHPSPLSRQQLVSLSQSSCVWPIGLTEWRGGGGVEPNHTTARKLLFINDSILSDFHALWRAEGLVWGLYFPNTYLLGYTCRLTSDDPGRVS